MYSSDKHKHKAFSAKVEIIKKLDKGEKLINLAKAYGVGRVKKAHQVQQLPT
jgi:hypothetical protein